MNSNRKLNGKKKWMRVKITAIELDPEQAIFQQCSQQGTPIWMDSYGSCYYFQYSGYTWQSCPVPAKDSEASGSSKTSEPSSAPS